MTIKKTAFLILAAFAVPAIASADTFSVFESDFAPASPEDHDPEIFAPGWWPGAEGGTGSYPIITWQNDAERAPVDSNGYFKEARRAAGSTDPMYLHSDLIWTQPLQGGTAVISFDFKVGTDPDFNDGENSGVLDFRFEQWVDGEGWVNGNLRLFDNGNTLASDNIFVVEGSFDADSVVVGEPDANGWRNVSIKTEFLATSDVRVWVAPWTFGDASAGGHFLGSWGIDNVSLSEDLSGFDDAVGVELSAAAEVEFFGEAGRFYQIESSTDGGDTWTPESAEFVGSGDYMNFLFSTRDDELKREFRVIGEQD